MQNEVDYTMWRKGRHAGVDGVIDVCPRCGRKGATRIAMLGYGKHIERRLIVIHKYCDLTNSPIPSRYVPDMHTIKLDTDGRVEESHGA